MDSDLRRVLVLVLLSPLMHLVSSDLRGYFFRNGSRQWEAANTVCRRHNSGLLIIRDKEHADTLSEKGWVGLRRIDGVWTWVNGEPLGVSDIPWERGEKNMQINIFTGVLDQC